MSISEEIKAIINKIQQNKVQFNLDRQTARISGLSSGNVCKYEFLTGKDILSGKYLQKKAAALEIFNITIW